MRLKFRFEVFFSDQVVILGFGRKFGILVKRGEVLVRRGLFIKALTFGRQLKYTIFEGRTLHHESPQSDNCQTRLFFSGTENNPVGTQRVKKIKTEITR